MLIVSDEVVVAAGGNVTALESEATNSNAELKVGNGSNKMQSFLKAASVTQKFKTQLANLMTCIEGWYHAPHPNTHPLHHTL